MLNSMSPAPPCVRLLQGSAHDSDADRGTGRPARDRPARVRLIGSGSRKLEESSMAKHFEVGDHVRWNSEAGHVEGTITERVKG